MPTKIIKDTIQTLKKDAKKKVEQKKAKIEMDIKKIRKFKESQQKIAKKAIVAAKKNKGKLLKKKVVSQLKLRFDMVDEIQKARKLLALKTDKDLIVRLVKALKKIKAQLEKNHAPKSDTARRSALKALIVVNIVDEILKERKKHTHDKFFYKTASHEIKRFFTVFHKLTAELHKQAHKKK